MNGKGLLAGIIGGIVYTVISYVLMSVVPGANEWYASTFPGLMSANGILAMTASTFVLGFFMGLIYSVIISAVPGNGFRKSLNYGIMVWLLAGLMWPIMMMGFAPVSIWISQFVTSFVNYVITGIVIAAVYKPKK